MLQIMTIYIAKNSVSNVQKAKKSKSYKEYMQITLKDE